MKGADIYSTDSAFAAVLKDGTVVTWGDKECGGDSSSVKTSLRRVHKIFSTSRAFAAILEDGTVVTWGDEKCGGDSSNIKSALIGVKKIYSTSWAFAAVLKNGGFEDFEIEEEKQEPSTSKAKDVEEKEQRPVKSRGVSFEEKTGEPRVSGRGSKKQLVTQQVEAQTEDDLENYLPKDLVTELKGAEDAEQQLKKRIEELQSDVDACKDMLAKVSRSKSQLLYKLRNATEVVKLY